MGTTAEEKVHGNENDDCIDLNRILFDVQAIMEKRGASQSQVARESGVSVTALSQLFGGSYPSHPGRQLEKLEKWVAAQNAKISAQHSLPPLKEWTSTPTSERIMAALGYAQMAGDISVVYGAAGLGKTATAREYAHRYPNVWIVTASSATAGSVPMFLEEILLSLGIRELPQGAARLHREAVRRMPGSGGLLIIGEAQHLCLGALDEVRSLHDATGVGLALLGNEVIYARMTGGTRAAYLDRLFSRIGKRVKLTRTVNADVAAVAATYGIKDDSCLRLLVEIGGRAGGLRSVVKTVRLAIMMAGAETLDASHLRAAWNDLEG